jgi:phosphopantothenoylcysteine decarboxylase / phosphopantothenate---cysteine ligase
MTGSIGALWAAQFVLELRVRRLVSAVHVVMSASAAQLVTPVAMRAVSGAEVLTGLFDPDAPFPVGHLQIAEDADVVIVMPATANIIGKAANAIADDAVSAVIVAAACPVVFVPNMHERMWSNPLVQRNVKRLVDAGHHVVPPVAGPAVSTGRYALGGMPPFETIINATRAALR